MAQPLLVKLSSGLPSGDVDTIGHLIELVATLMDAPLEHTEIHVKYSTTRGPAQTTGYAYYNYNGLPFAAQARLTMLGKSCDPRACELITLKMSKGYAERYRARGPHTLHYWRYKTFPYTTVYSWEEEFVYICAHEMHHISQYHRPRLRSGRASASELECEGIAMTVLALYRMVLAKSGQGVAARS